MYANAADLVVYVADIGSVRLRRFGWASSADKSGDTMEGLVEAVEASLEGGMPVALGLECPLWVPMAAAPKDLTAARIGERNRPWSAGAGSGALATGLVQATWLLASLRKHVPQALLFLDWGEFSTAAEPKLLVWEAFVSSTGKGAGHIADAQIAVQSFLASLPDPQAHVAVPPAADVLSLIGAVAVRTGWSSDLSLLKTPLVIGRISAERVGMHEIVWEEPAFPGLCGHGVVFRLKIGDSSFGQTVAFIDGYGWLHAPGKSPVVVRLYRHGEGGDDDQYGPIGTWPRVRAKAQDAVRQFLLASTMPRQGTRYGKIAVAYNA